MKIVIELPEWYIKETKEFKHPNFVDKAIAEGRRLDEDIEKTESDNKGERTDGDLTLKEVRQMCESRDCGDCSFSLSCHRLFKGMPSQWLEMDLNKAVKEGGAK